MEPISILLIGLSIGAGGALLTISIMQKMRCRGYTDRTLVLSESQGAHAKQTTDALVALQKKMDKYDALLGALRATQPEVIMVFVPTKPLPCSNR